MTEQERIIAIQRFDPSYTGYSDKEQRLGIATARKEAKLGSNSPKSPQSQEQNVLLIADNDEASLRGNHNNQVFTENSDGILIQQGNKVNTQDVITSDDDLQAYIGYIASEKQVDNTYNGETRSLYEFESTTGEDVKIGLSLGYDSVGGELIPAKARYIPEFIPDYGWVPGPDGVDTDKNGMQLVMDKREAIVAEGAIHDYETRKGRRTNMREPGKIGFSAEINERFGSGKSEYYKNDDYLGDTSESVKDAAWYANRGKAIFEELHGKQYDGLDYKAPKNSDGSLYRPDASSNGYFENTYNLGKRVLGQEAAKIGDALLDAAIGEDALISKETAKDWLGEFNVADNGFDFTGFDKYKKDEAYDPVDTSKLIAAQDSTAKFAKDGGVSNFIDMALSNVLALDQQLIQSAPETAEAMLAIPTFGASLGLLAIRKNNEMLETRLTAKIKETGDTNAELTTDDYLVSGVSTAAYVSLSMLTQGGIAFAKNNSMAQKLLIKPVAETLGKIVSKLPAGKVTDIMSKVATTLAGGTVAYVAEGVDENVQTFAEQLGTEAKNLGAKEFSRIYSDEKLATERLEAFLTAGFMGVGMKVGGDVYRKIVPDAKTRAAIAEAKKTKLSDIDAEWSTTDYAVDDVNGRKIAEGLLLKSVQQVSKEEVTQFAQNNPKLIASVSEELQAAEDTNNKEPESTMDEQELAIVGDDAIEAIDAGDIKMLEIARNKLKVGNPAIDDSLLTQWNDSRNTSYSTLSEAIDAENEKLSNLGARVEAGDTSAQQEFNMYVERRAKLVSSKKSRRGITTKGIVPQDLTAELLKMIRKEMSAGKATDAAAIQSLKSVLKSEGATDEQVNEQIVQFESAIVNIDKAQEVSQALRQFATNNNTEEVSSEILDDIVTWTVDYEAAKLSGDKTAIAEFEIKSAKLRLAEQNKVNNLDKGIAKVRSEVSVKFDALVARVMEENKGVTEDQARGAIINMIMGRDKGSKALTILKLPSSNASFSESLKTDIRNLAKPITVKYAAETNKKGVDASNGGDYIFHPSEIIMLAAETSISSIGVSNDFTPSVILRGNISSELEILEQLGDPEVQAKVYETSNPEDVTSTVEAIAYWKSELDRLQNVARTSEGDAELRIVIAKLKELEAMLVPDENVDVVEKKPLFSTLKEFVDNIKKDFESIVGAKDLVSEYWLEYDRLSKVIPAESRDDLQKQEVKDIYTMLSYANGDKISARDFKKVSPEVRTLITSHRENSYMEGVIVDIELSSAIQKRDKAIIEGQREVDKAQELLKKVKLYTKKEKGKVYNKATELLINIGNRADKLIAKIEEDIDKVINYTKDKGKGGSRTRREDTIARVTDSGPLVKARYLVVAAWVLKGVGKVTKGLVARRNKVASIAAGMEELAIDTEITRLELLVINAQKHLRRVAIAAKAENDSNNAKVNSLLDKSAVGMELDELLVDSFGTQGNVTAYLSKGDIAVATMLSQDEELTNRASAYAEGDKGINFDSKGTAKFTAFGGMFMKSKVIQRAVVAAALEFAGTRLQEMKEMDARTASKILGIQEELVTPDMMANLIDKQIGGLKSIVAKQLGATVIKYAGMKSKKDISGHQAIIEESAGMIALDYLAQEGYIDGLKYSSILPEDLSIEASNKDVRIQVVKPTNKPANVADTKMIEALIPDSYSDNKIIPRFSKKRHGVKAEEIRNIEGMTKTAADQETARKKAENTKHTVNIELMVEILDASNVDKYKKLLGYVEEDVLTNGSYEKGEILSQRGKNNQIDRELKGMQWLVDNEAGYVYMDYFVGKNGRLYLDGNLVNPQSFKHLQRFLVLPYSITNVEYSAKELEEAGVKAAIAQGFGAGIDTMKDSDIAEFADAILTMSEEQLDEAKEVILEGGKYTIEGTNIKLGYEHVSQMLLTVVAVKKIINSQGEPVKLTLALEVDGKTNGFAMKLLQQPVYKYDELMEWLERTAVLVGDKTGSGKGTNEILGEDGFQDSYMKGVNKLADMSTDEVIADADSNLVDVDKYKMNTVRYGTVDSARILLGNHEIVMRDEDGKITKAGRNLGKPPFMVTNYGSGGASAQRALSEVLSSEFITNVMRAVKLDDKGNEVLDDSYAETLLEILKANGKGTVKGKDGEVFNLDKATAADMRKRLYSYGLSGITVSTTEYKAEGFGKDKTIETSSVDITLGEYIGSIYNNTYSQVVVDSVTEMLAPFESSNRAINDYFKVKGLLFADAYEAKAKTAMLDEYQPEIDSKSEARNNGSLTAKEWLVFRSEMYKKGIDISEKEGNVTVVGITREIHEEVVKELKVLAPVIKGPISLGLEDGIAIFDTVLDYDGNTLSVPMTSTEEEYAAAKVESERTGKDVSPQATITLQLVTRRIKEAAQSGAVITIHYLDGAIMAKVLKKFGFDNVFDAMVLGPREVEKVVREYNKVMYELNMSWSLLEEVGKGWDELQKIEGIEDTFSSINEELGNDKFFRYEGEDKVSLTVRDIAAQFSSASSTPLMNRNKLKQDTIELGHMPFSRGSHYVVEGAVKSEEVKAESAILTDIINNFKPEELKKFAKALIDQGC